MDGCSIVGSLSVRYLVPPESKKTLKPMTFFATPENLFLEAWSLLSKTYKGLGFRGSANTYLSICICTSSKSFLRDLERREVLPAGKSNRPGDH